MLEHEVIQIARAAAKEAQKELLKKLLSQSITDRERQWVRDTAYELNFWDIDD